ncbi:DUF6323 family protein [Halocella sp. SP3-1]|uniref:DUF6323 family protein n=1 Tax=Halocella sp. SP3-1 TaxID=2382161 RepID=UPI000F751E52|nr:DUF6323 family protein [Halocella sp. SP3-1]AZO95739.1 hypothetical protein D7D81_14730 [Halocella sp. SP3-1]
MNLPDIFNTAASYNNQLLETNLSSKKYGLKLTEKDVSEIIEDRERVLNHQGRVELDIKVTVKIIEFLYSSPYVNQDNYSDTVIGLQEIFYYLKSETDDQIADDILLNKIFKLYENICAGSLELLRGREADKLINKIKYQDPDKEVADA